MTIPATTVRVELHERSYDIKIGSGLLADVANWSQSVLIVRHAVVVTDSNVAPTHAATVAQSLTDRGIRASLAVVPAGESSKSIRSAESLWETFLRERTDRKSAVVAVGGGVVGDLAGFAAATYARGLPFLQIPTTLLAQVDSSVGGKVGVNLPGAKNMVGAFWQPRGVLIDLDVLNTLPDREYRAGLAEVVKYGVILDAHFFEYLEQHVPQILERDPHVVQKLVARSCELKAVVVKNDEREETGLRAVLNYGHTFCHAIEAVTDYGRYLHGEAVSIGMICASRLAELLGRVPADLTERQHRLLSALGLPVELPDLPREALLEAMRHDKKVEHGQLRFVLPSRLGHVELVRDVSDDLALQAMA